MHLSFFCFIPADPPGRPEVTDVTRSTVSLSWSAPLYDGGSKIIGYIIERKPYDKSGDGRWLKCNYTIVSENCFTVTALSEDEAYEFRVLAKNAAGVISKGSESTGAVICKDEYCKKYSLETIKNNVLVLVLSCNLILICFPYDSTTKG